MKKLTVLFVLLVSSLNFISCDNDTSEMENLYENQATDKDAPTPGGGDDDDDNND